MQPRKIVIIIALVAVVIACLIVVVKRVGMMSGGQPPQQTLDRPIEKIDVKTLEAVTLPLEKWDKLACDASGHYKNPKTGDYTMTSIITCAACGAKIPEPDYPEGGSGPDVRLRAKAAVQQGYKCPKCGQSPFPH